jgi:ribosome biogenesis GTPase
VLAALESGDLDTARWESYRKLEAELRYLHRSQDQQAMLAQKKQWKALHKAMRNHPKYRR